MDDNSYHCLGGAVLKNPPANAGDMDLILGLGSSPGGGHGNSLQYSYLENPMDRGAWRAAVRGVAKSPTRLSDFTLTFTLEMCLRLGSWEVAELRR